MRQANPDLYSEPFARALAVAYPHGYELPEHGHDWDQLIHATEGAMRVQAGRTEWFVPPHRALWVPAGLRHRLIPLARLSLRTVYLEPDVVRLPSDACLVIDLAPLLRELVRHVVASAPLFRNDPRDVRLVRVLVDQLELQARAPLSLPWPVDERARRVASRMADHPRSPASIEALVSGSGASKRTIERLFCDETGLTVGRWRRQLRLLRSLERLAAGDDVTRIAYEVGYESPSAFISAFRRTFGTTPGRYFADASAAARGP